MELTFSDLRSKEVVNTQDGRKLGKVCDILLCYPENRWLGVVVPGENSFFHKKNELFIDLRNIVKIGDDVILVNIGFPRGERGGHNRKNNCTYSPCPPAPRNEQSYGGTNTTRNYEEME